MELSYFTCMFLVTRPFHGSEDEPIPKKRKVAKNTVRQKWSSEEFAEIEKYFKSYLDAGITPRSKEVQFAMAKSKKNKGVLWMRKSNLIIKKISYMNKDKR